MRSSGAEQCSESWAWTFMLQCTTVNLKLILSLVLVPLSILGFVNQDVHILFYGAWLLRENSHGVDQEKKYVSGGHWFIHELRCTTLSLWQRWCCWRWYDHWYLHPYTYIQSLFLTSPSPSQSCHHHHHNHITIHHHNHITITITIMSPSEKIIGEEQSWWKQA